MINPPALEAVQRIPSKETVAATRSLPLMVVEGGWSSGSLGTFQSSPQLRARYIHRQSELLPQPPGSILPLFATLGMVDTQLRPKPALAVCDSLYARRVQ